MKRSIITISVVTLLMTVSSMASAQKKSETKAFKKALKTQTIEGFDKFLDKYPKSVYVPELLRKKDSIIIVQNTSPYSVEESGRIFASIKGMQEGTFLSYPIRRDNVDYIYAAVKKELNNGREPIIWHVLTKQSGAWLELQAKEIERYIASDNINGFYFTDTMTVIRLSDEKYLRFCYVNTSPSKEREYVANLIKISDGSHYCTMFSGKLLPSDDGAEQIEGTADMISNDSLTPMEMRYLRSLFSENKLLVPISEADAQTDESIEWWYHENKLNATTLSFGIVPETSSLVKKYKTIKEKEHSKNYDAAVLDIRDNTVICAYRKSSKQYILVWCEPVAADPDHDKYLNNIHFESDNSLVVYYYKGKTTSKKRINLATKSVK